MHQRAIERLKAQLQRHARFLAVAVWDIHNQRRFANQPFHLGNDIQVRVGRATGRGDEFCPVLIRLQDIAGANPLRDLFQVRQGEPRFGDSQHQEAKGLRTEDFIQLRAQVIQSLAQYGDGGEFAQ